jgi:hypothetical protein
VLKWSEAVRGLLSYMRTNKRVEKLFKISDSPKYLKRLYEQVAGKRRSIGRCVRGQEEQRLRQQELATEAAELAAKQRLVVTKTKELQKFVCADLSKRYNGVRINLMGEINLL